MPYERFWGVVLTTPTSENAELAGTTATDLNFDLGLYWVNDPANGGIDGHIYDNDLNSAAGDDTTVGQPGEGVADSDGGPVVGVAEIGVFRDSEVELTTGETITVDLYSFRLEDGRTLLRVDFATMGGVVSAGYTPRDFASATLSGADKYEALTSVDYRDFLKDFGVICFADGTLIETADGPVAVEDLRPGMMLRTADRGLQPLRLALRREVGSALLSQKRNLRPVRISAGALGAGMPTRDLRVSRQHRILVSSRICQRMFGQSEILVPAIRLTDLPGVFVEDDLKPLTYFHLVFDQHEVVFAEGIAAESLFLGENALESLTPEAREELLTLFPDAADECDKAVTLRPVPQGARLRKLMARHAKSGQPLVV